MSNPDFERVILDPNAVDESMQQLATRYGIGAELLNTLSQVVGLYPHAIRMYVDEANALLFHGLSLADKFTFDLESDELVLFSLDADTVTDAFIEMAMYLSGFATLMGSQDDWTVEFAIGAWKPIKNRIKRQLGIPVREKPRIVVGLPPAPQEINQEDSYPFRKLVSSYDFASFHQMVVLAAREDVAVYFPPETHSKVLAVYVYMRRAIQEVAQGLDLSDHLTFNTRLIDAVQRLEKLFSPATLAPPGWQQLPDSHRSVSADYIPTPDAPAQMPDDRVQNGEQVKRDDPFELFINQLFSDDDLDES